MLTVCETTQLAGDLKIALDVGSQDEHIYMPTGLTALYAMCLLSKAFYLEKTQT